MHHLDTQDDENFPRLSLFRVLLSHMQPLPTELTTFEAPQPKKKKDLMILFSIYPLADNTFNSDKRLDDEPAG